MGKLPGSPTERVFPTPMPIPASSSSIIYLVGTPSSPEGLNWPGVKGKSFPKEYLASFII
jgi:hypothetical protein